MHVLGIGQSNLANHCGSRRSSDLGRVTTVHGTAPLRDPIPGGTGAAGSVWPRLADELGARGLVSTTDPLRLTLAAQGGASIEDLGRVLVPALRDRLAAGEGRGVTHVIFQQGEKDTKLRTTTDDYRAAFMALYDAVSDAIGPASWIICRSSYRLGETSAQVVRAQNQALASIAGSVAGPDLDLLGPELRSDDAHFNDAGLERFAAALAEVLAAVRPSRAQGTANR